MKNWKQLTIYISESDTWYHQPLYQVLLGLAHQQKITGITVTKAIAGYGKHGIFRTLDKVDILTESSALPLIITIIDEEDSINNFTILIQDIIQGKFVTHHNIEILAT